MPKRVEEAPRPTLDAGRIDEDAEESSLDMQYAPNRLAGGPKGFAVHTPRELNYMGAHATVLKMLEEYKQTVEGLPNQRPVDESLIK